MGLIYKVTNDINDKIYIGKTVRALYSRWHDHVKARNYDNNNKFHNALAKYGIEHFSAEIVEDNIPLEKINEREKYWINFYDSYNSGYNSTLGGEGDTKYDPKIILQLWNDGCTCSEISNRLGCQYMTASYVLSEYGIDTEQKNLRSAAKRQITNGTPIEQYTFEGELVATYISSKEVIAAGFDRNEVNRCCAHKAHSHKGYLWKRVTDDTPIEILVNQNKNKRRTAGRIRPY